MPPVPLTVSLAVKPLAARVAPLVKLTVGATYKVGSFADIATGMVSGKLNEVVWKPVAHSAT